MKIYKELLLVSFLIVGIVVLNGISEIEATSYDDSLFTLSWTTVTNAIALDTDKNGKADQLYSHNTAGQIVTFTKVLGTGSTSGAVTMGTTPANHVLNKITTDGSVIYLGSSYVIGSNCTFALGSYNVTSDAEASSVITEHQFGHAGTAIARFGLGMTGNNSEPVLHTLCDDNGLTFAPTQYRVKNSTTDIIRAMDNLQYGISTIENAVGDLYISPNGTKMYIVGQTNDRVYQFTLAVANNTATASYDNISFLVSGQETAPNALTFNNNGTKMFVLGETADSVFQYVLTNPYDVSSASYGGVFYNVGFTVPTGLAFSSNGTKMYVVENGASSVLRQYTLSTAFNPSTATVDVSVNTDVICGAGGAMALHFSGDGKYAWTQNDSDNICGRTFSNAWHIPSGTGFGFVGVVGTDSSIHGIHVVDNGNYIAYAGAFSDKIYQFYLPTPNFVTTQVARIGNNTFSATPFSTMAFTGNGYSVDTNNIVDNEIGSSVVSSTGLCGSTGCMANGSDWGFALQSSGIVNTVGAIVDPAIIMYNAGMEMPHTSLIDNIETLPVKLPYWYSYVPQLDYSKEIVLPLLHTKLLNSALTTDPYRFIFDDGINEYIMYVSGTSIVYAPISDSMLTSRAVGYYYPDAVIDAFDTSLTTSTLATNSYDLVTPVSTTTFANSGLVSILSGYELQTASTVLRSMNTEVNNEDRIVPYTIGVSASQDTLSILIKNSPDSSGISIRDESNKLLTDYYTWSEDFVRADNTFDVDLPSLKCVDVYIKDLTINGSVWESLGNICNTGAMPKTLVYSSNLSFTFWSLPYGVSHTYDNDDDILLTKVRHDISPFNYTVKIYDSNNVEQFSQEYMSNSTTMDMQTINASGISKPSMLKVFNEAEDQIYYSNLGLPSYLSASVLWFNEWLTIEGFNLLFMLPIVFGAMFTRNTVGIGTMSTVAFIATLNWFGIITLPDVAIYLMIFIAVIGVIAYKKLYD